MQIKEMYYGDDEDPPSPGDFPDVKSVLLIYSVVESLQRGEPENLIADLETIDIAHGIHKTLRNCGYPVTMAAICSEEDVLEAVAHANPQTTLVFNLCETLGGLADKESRVPYLLDELGFCYVGATGENLDACLNKSDAKARLLKHGIPTAPYQVFHTCHDPLDVPLPAIVKPVSEHCSFGINYNSVVNDPAALRQQVSYILDIYRQPALVEMFLDGREFSVSMWGNGLVSVLGIAQIDFSNHDGMAFAVDNFDTKWNNRFAAIYPAPIDRHFKQSISQIALATYRIMGCRDYARVDIREKDGQLYVLDVNPNPSLATAAGFARAGRAAGYSYKKIIDRLVKLAWQRHHHQIKEAVYDPLPAN
jgi:D-alanine-D-alanine ligase